MKNPWLERELFWGMASSAGIAAFAILVVWFAAAMEAGSYNKFCTTQVTTWDAVWLDLRIDECTKQPSHEVTE
jgi:hypothetical protein